MTALKTLIFSILIPGTVAFAVPYSMILRQSERSLALGEFRFVGLIAVLFGIAIYLTCAWDFTFVGKGTPAPFDPPRVLVVKGPYRYVRNPMYLAVCLVVLGQAMLFESMRLLNYLAIIFIGFNLIVILYEEPTLTRKFGARYGRYCRSVSRWLPGAPYQREVE